MLRKSLIAFAIGPILALGSIRARGDQFEQLEGPILARAIRGADASPRPSLTIGDIGAMPSLLRDTRSALVLAKTGLGNPARLLLSAELRKPGSGQGGAIPVLVVERLDTFDGSDPGTRLASRKEIVLYDGFRLDLDSGQVVPDGQGGDLVFRLGGEGDPRLEPIAPAQLFTLTKAPQLDPTRGPRPSPGRAVVPADFAGRYRLFANGQWSGTLELKVEGRGVVVGRFRSDLHGTSYPVTGQVAPESPARVRFAISFPRTRQEFDAYLWTEGKGAMAGTVTLLDRPFGFFAVREGGRYAPEGRDLGPLEPADDGPDPDRPGRQVITFGRAGATLDGRSITVEEMARTLKTLAEAEGDPAPWALVRVEPEVPFGDLRKLLEAIEAAGVRTIRLGPPEGPK